MERLNLNIPSEARKRLRRLARAASRTESEVARDLLVGAIAQSERQAFYRKVAENTTDEHRKRMIQIQQAFEALDG